MYKICKTKQSAQRQRQIVDCLLEMMQTQTFDQITVLALCQKARIPRKSFYRYFECKEDVFLAAADFLAMDYDRFDGPYRPGASEARAPDKELEKIFLFWQERQVLLTAILRSRLGETVVSHLSGQIFTGFTGLTPADSGFSEAERRAAALFVTTGMLALVIDWIGRGCTESAAQMAQRAGKLLTHPLYRAP